MKTDFIFTSESLTEGHPDKLCDAISDTLVDRFLQQDACSRIIAECAVFTSIVFIAARFQSPAIVDFAHVARDVIKQAGYTEPLFDSKACSVVTSLRELAYDEYYCFDERTLSGEEIERFTVKNQANVFGFACNQTAALMPLPIWLAHKLTRKLTSERAKKTLPYLAPDGKTQVGVEYRNRHPYRIHSITVVASQQKKDEPSLTKLNADVRDAIIKPAFTDENIRPDENTKIFINPDGPFLVGGPSVHSGLTGRQNAVDTYGEYSRNSSSALSGKDPLRIDRVGAYAARYAAKNVVASGLADECEVQLTYSIGFSGPVSIHVESFGTGKIPDEEIAARVQNHFDFRLAGIVKEFNLRRLPSLLKGGFYRKLATYGHVGRMDIGLPWEITDKARELAG